MNDLIKWILFGLKPPTLPAGREPTEEERCRYLKQNNRQKHAVAYVLWAILIFGSGFVLWSRGALHGWWGFGPGFAYAQDVEQKAHDLNVKVDAVVTAIDKLLLSQLRSDLRETRRLHCIAKKENNVVLASKYFDELEDLKEQFHEAVGREWNQPRCEDM